MVVTEPTDRFRSYFLQQLQVSLQASHPLSLKDAASPNIPPNPLPATKTHSRRRGRGRSASSYDVDGAKARGKMTSVLEASNLDDFIASAMMSERAFESHKENTVVVGPDGIEMSLDENGEINPAGAAKDAGGDVQFDFKHMNVPRRPPWGAGMTAEELDLLERKSFLEWRRGIAK